MEMNNYYMEQEQENKGSVITGLIGAILGALIGAVVWAGVAVLLDIITGLIGFLIGFLASKGYDLLKGRQGKVKLVCVILAIIIGVLAGTAGCYLWDAHNVYVEETQDMNAFQRAMVPTESEFMKLVFEDSEVQSEMIKNLLLGLVFAVLGCIDLFREMTAKPSAAPATADLSAAAVPQADEAQPETSADLPSSDDSAFN